MYMWFCQLKNVLKSGYICEKRTSVGYNRRISTRSDMIQTCAILSDVRHTAITPHATFHIPNSFYYFIICKATVTTVTMEAGYCSSRTIPELSVLYCPSWTRNRIHMLHVYTGPDTTTKVRERAMQTSLIFSLSHGEISQSPPSFS